MKGLAALVGKNLKVLIRAKASSLVIVLGPLLLVFLAGVAFDNADPYALKVGAYAPVYTDTVYKIFDELRDRFGFTEYISEDECTGALTKNRVHACVLFAENFTMGVPGRNDVVIVTDYSRVNLVGTIMTVINEQVGEGVSELSLDLTKELVGAVEFTKSRIAMQRDVLVRLTTENQLVSESGRALSADLSDVDLSFDPADFASTNLTSAKNKIQHWVDNAFTIAQNSLTRAASFISDADAAVDIEDQEAFQDALQSSVGKIAQLREDLATSKDIAETNFAEFDSQLSSLISDLGIAKQRFEQADESRQLGLRVIDAVLALLDNSLIHLLQVQLFLNEIDKRLDAIQITDPEAIVQPVVTSVRPIMSEASYLDYVFPSLIALVIMFTALLIGPTIVQLERNSPAYFRSVMAPTCRLLSYAAYVITCLLLIAGQLVIILSIAGVAFSAQVLSALPLALFALLFVCFVFVSLGLIIGYLFNSEETAILAGISLGAVLLFLGDIIIPLESMPLFVRVFAEYNPFILASDLLRSILLFGRFSYNSFWLLLVYSALLVTVSVFLFRRRKAI